MKTRDTGRPLFNAMEEGIDNIGIVVRDAVKTAKRYSEMFRLGPWSFYDVDPTLTILQDKPVEGVEFGVRVAVNTLGKVRIELIQPLYGPSSYMAFLQGRGEGIHHLGFGFVEEYDRVVKDLKAHGLSVEMQAVLPDSQHITHFGPRQDLGVIFEIAKPMAGELEPWGTYEPQEPGWISTEGKRIAQIGIVVEDVEGVARRFWEVLGIGPWYLFDWMPPVGYAKIFHGVSVRQEVTSRIKGAIADHPGFQFELLEPVSGPGTHMEYLRTQGVGAHHVSLDIVEDHDEMVAELQERGVEIEMAGMAGLAYQYTYLATQQDLGTVWEAVKFFPGEDEMGGLYAVYPPTEDEESSS